MENIYVNDFGTSTRTYYTELKKCKPLTKEREKELLLKAKEGDLDAQNQVLISNLKFVFSMAKRYRGKGVSIADLISEGNIGLLKAMEKFDTDKDVKFISYAVWWIRNQMQEFIKKQQCIDTYEKEDTILNSEIHDKLGDDEDEVITKRDTVMSDEDETNKQEASKKQKEIVEQLLSKLDEREKYIVTSYYGIGVNEEMNLEEIGNQLHITKERVRQIKSVAMNKLRSEIFMIEGADLFF